MQKIKPHILGIFKYVTIFAPRNWQSQSIPADLCKGIRCKTGTVPATVILTKKVSVTTKATVACAMGSHILHQIGTMATFATIGTIGYIDSKRHLVRYLLKYDVIISVLEHSISAQPPSAVAERSC